MTHHPRFPPKSGGGGASPQPIPLPLPRNAPTAQPTKVVLRRPTFSVRRSDWFRAPLPRDRWGSLKKGRGRTLACFFSLPPQRITASRFLSPPPTPQLPPFPFPPHNGLFVSKATGESSARAPLSCVNDAVREREKGRGGGLKRVRAFPSETGGCEESSWGGGREERDR